MFSRRDFGKMVVGGLPLSLALAASKINSKINGVQIGAQSYSFRDLPLDECIKGYAKVGLGECKLYLWPHFENPDRAPQPAGGGGRPPQTREELRKWRLTTPDNYFQGVRKKFEDAGVTIYAVNISFNDSFTEDEINRSFEVTKLLGAKLITASATLSSIKKVVPFAEKHKMVVAMHGHDQVENPNEFAKPESFAAAMAMTKYFWVNLDIGHFTAAGYDPVDYIKQHHDRIAVIHLKDRKRNTGRSGSGPNTPWGEGDTKIKEVLQLVKKEKYNFPANIEYEYRGAADSVTEVKKCFEYAKAALA